MDTDRNLLFGVLALQADLITAAQFAEACSAWAARKSAALAELLVERGWLTPSDRGDVEKLVLRKLAKHGGDARAGLAEVTSDHLRQSLAGVADPEVRATLTGATPPPQGHVLIATTDHVPEARERYSITRLHATGGIGRVWLARDASLGREVALKELRPERAGQPAVCARFLREAQVTGQLEHPGIVPVYELGRRPDGHAPFYTMRFVRGRTLAEKAAGFHQRRARGEAGPLELRELLTEFVGVCNAVAYAHSRGVIHRDLKPHNVILGDFGEVIVLDWGLAKVTGDTAADDPVAPPPLTPEEGDARDRTLAGQVLGTPAYMAPEQAEARPDLLTPRTDVYGLGAVLYEVLTGRPPFTAADTETLLRKVTHEPPDRPRAVVPGTPAALEVVCLKSLAKKPADRYASAKELATEVQHWLADEPVTAYREPPPVRAGRWVRHHRTLVTTAAAAGLVALVGLAVVLGLQAKANADLGAKNVELAAANARERERFDLALEAVRTFHTGVSRDLLLKQKEFGPLRAELLRQAREFYRKLEALLEGHADRDSRLALARAYFQIGELTSQLDSAQEALAAFRRAQVLFEELSREAGPGLRRDEARCWSEIASLLQAAGKRPEALAAVERGVALLREVTAADPDDAAARADLGMAELRVGYCSAGPTEALEAFQRARTLLEPVAREVGASREVRVRLASVYISTGAYLNHPLGRTDEAVVWLKRARDLLEALHQEDPTDAGTAMELSRTLGNLAVAYSGQGATAEELAAYERARAVLRTVGGLYPNLLQAQRNLAWIEGNIGALLLADRRETDALAVLGSALRLREKLARDNPDDVRHQTERIRVLRQIARTHVQAGQPDKGREALAQALAVAAPLAEARPKDPDVQSELAYTYSDGADLEMTAGKPADAAPLMEKAVAIRRGVLEAGSDVPGYRAELASALRHQGIVLAKAGPPAEAVSALRESIRLLAGLERPAPADLYNLACAQSLLVGLAGVSGSGMPAADGPPLAERAMKTLRRAVDAGYRKVGLIRPDPDLDPLRGREDFRKLLADLEAEEKARSGAN